MAGRRVNVESIRVTDHGALTGLADDDHPQYATDTDLTTHAAAADPHTGYRLESADHSHASTGAQGGQVAYASITGTPTAGTGVDINGTVIDLDHSEFTSERLVRSTDDEVAFYDLSAAAMRKVPVGELSRGGRSRVTLYDDMIMGQTSEVFAGGLVGSSANGGTTASPAAIATNPGVMALRVGTTNNSTGQAALTPVNKDIVVGAGAIRIGWIAKVNTVPTAALDAFHYMGLYDNASHQILITGSSGNSVKWVLNSYGGGLATLNTTVALDTNWHTFELVINAGATSLELFIDGTSAGTLACSGNQIPTNAMALFASCTKVNTTPAHTTNRQLLIDAYWMEIELTTSR